MRIGSLFAGIGGLELGLEMSGLGHTVWQVEQSEFCRGVLARHWPRAERFRDVREVGARNLSQVDIVCGGFPCQDISSAGKGEGLSGSRSGLWFEYARIIEELGPRWVVVENVASGAKKWVDQVSSHLGELGYGTLPIPISAADVGAPHLRRRVFIVAYSDKERVRLKQGGRERACWPYPIQPVGPRQEGFASRSQSWETLAHICGAGDGVPDRVERLAALGNAVVPQCAEVVGHVIQELVRQAR